MTYDVVRDGNLDDLIDKVNVRIADGWVPLGGICEGDRAFYQAVTRSVISGIIGTIAAQVQGGSGSHPKPVAAVPAGP